MPIEEIVRKLKECCPKAIIGSSERDGLWYVYVYPVGSVDGAPAFYNTISPEIIDKIDDNTIQRMGNTINGFINRA